MMKLVSFLPVLLAAHASAAFLKSGSGNICMDRDDNGVMMGYCESSSSVPEYVAMAPEALVFVCDIDTYNDDATVRSEVSASGSTTTAWGSGQTITGQPDCEYAFAGEAVEVGDTSTGGWAAATFYLATGTGECRTISNNFYLDGTETNGICISPGGSGVPGSGGTCDERTFQNNEVKFSIFLQTTGNSYTLPTCTSTANPTATNIVGRFSVDMSNLGSGSTVYFNDDTSLTSSTVNGQVVQSITITSASFTDGNIKLDFPTATQYGTVNANQYSMEGDGTLSVRAYAGSSSKFYLDYIFPVSTVNAADKYVIFDPTVTASGSGAASPLVTLSALVTLGAASLASLVVY